ncbi:MAG: hypothetical protein WKG07_41145 [Hymenobacter sp.]
MTKLLAHPFLRRYQQWQDAQVGRAAVPSACWITFASEIVQRHLVLLPATELLRAGLRPPAHRGVVQDLEQLRRHYPGLLRAD